MTVVLILFSILIIATKLADCYTTATKIGSNYNFERNPLARKFMLKYGIQFTIWGIFL